MQPGALLEAVGDIVRAPVDSSPVWPPAQFLDAPLSSGGLLRALVCRVGESEWQWSILSLDRDRGELISGGVEPTASAAQQMATAEIDKCLENALA